MGPVLIVEDDPAIRELLVSVLADEGHRTVAVADGVEALRAVEREQPATGLLDLNLPRLDGEGVLRELRQRQVTAPVLFVRPDPLAGRVVDTEGVVGWVPKPFDLGSLLAAVALPRTPPLGTPTRYDA